MFFILDGEMMNYIEQLTDEEMDCLAERYYYEDLADFERRVIEGVLKRHNTGVAAKKKKGQVYGEKYLVMQNRLLNAITDLNLNERRLIMFLSPRVRRVIDKNPNERTFHIYVRDFVEYYKIQSKTYYSELEKTADSILKKAFFYWNFDKNSRTNIKHGVSWVSRCKYIENEGRLEIRLDEDVIEMLTIFDKYNPFTKIELQKVTCLGSYGIIMFLLISSCLNKNNKQAEYTIGFLREQFNCVNKYPLFTDFKRFVIQPAINEIELNTTLRISFETIKAGRKTIGLKFFFHEEVDNDELKPKKIDKLKDSQDRDKNTIDIFDELTDEELELIAQKNAYADEKRISPLHRQNLIKQAIEQHRQAKQAEQERKQREKAERLTQEQQDKEQLALAQRQFEQILASDELIRAYIANNINANSLTGVQKAHFEQGDFKGVFKMEEYKFEQLQYLSCINLSFLD